MRTFWNLLLILSLSLAFNVTSPVISSAQIENTTTMYEQENTGSVQNESDDSTNKNKKSKKSKKDEIKLDQVFFINLGINVLSMLIIILLIYFPNYKKLDYIFTFMLFNIVIFLLTYVLNDVKMSMGAAFGLFAVFSMLRYRTAGISIKDMTYLFIFIALGLLSAIRLDLIEVTVIHGILIFFVFIIDSNLIFKREFSKSINYENIELIKPEKHDELKEDLQKRTGLKIRRVVIGNIDYLKDTAKIKIYYYE